MTEEEIKAADIVLLRMIPNDPRVLGAELFREWLRQERENHNDDRFSNLILDATDSTYNKVHGFLLTDGYIGRVHAGHEEKYLTEKGVKARELGGHIKYLEYIQKQKRRNSIKNFPQNYWYIIAIAGWLIGIVTEKYILKANDKTGTRSKTLPIDTTTSQQPPSRKN